MGCPRVRMSGPARIVHRDGCRGASSACRPPSLIRMRSGRAPPTTAGVLCPARGGRAKLRTAMGRVRYLDHAATTHVDERVVEAMLPYFREHWGNPSSLYSLGRAARRALDESRDTIAGVLGCRPNEVLFTSGGSESDNLAIKGVAFARRSEE